MWLLHVYKMAYTHYFFCFFKCECSLFDENRAKNITIFLFKWKSKPIGAPDNMVMSGIQKTKTIADRVKLVAFSELPPQKYPETPTFNGTKMCLI